MATRQTFGHTWWGKAWVEALETSAGLDTGRLSRGRTYARNGSVGTITIAPGYASASVRGSHGRTYRTDVGVKTLAPSDWEQVAAAVGTRAAHVAALLDGELDPGVVADAASADVKLLPGAGDLRWDCSCPDWAEPCKHAAALVYLLANELDRDPFLLFLLRGLPRDELMALVRANRAGPGAAAPTAAERGVPAAEAWHRMPPDAPLPPLPGIVADLPVPRHPGRRTPLDASDLPSDLGIDPRQLDEIANDAVDRAWAMLADGMPSGLHAGSRPDLARRAATSRDPDAVARLARRSGVAPAALDGWAKAWRSGGETAVAVLSDPTDTWSTDQARLEAGREALVEAGHLRRSIGLSWNSLSTRGGVLLVLGPDDRWYAVQEVGRRGEMRLVAPPSPDIADLIDPPG
ncbi:MAG: SWIM zinc finger family protein [Acidimicrobiales bacterium]